MKIDRIQTGIRLQPTKIDQLDKYAKKLGISRNNLMENLIETGLDDLKLLDGMGMLVIGKGLREVADKIRRSESQTEFDL